MWFWKILAKVLQVDEVAMSGSRADIHFKRMSSKIMKGCWAPRPDFWCIGCDLVWMRLIEQHNVLDTVVCTSCFWRWQSDDLTLLKNIFKSGWQRGRFQSAARRNGLFEAHQPCRCYWIAPLEEEFAASRLWYRRSRQRIRRISSSMHHHPIHGQQELQAHLAGSVRGTTDIQVILQHLLWRSKRRSSLTLLDLSSLHKQPLFSPWSDSIVKFRA